MQLNQIFNIDCMDFMQSMPYNCIDLILTDPPYGITQCKWDVETNLDKLWKNFNKIIKSKSAIVMFASQPFSSKLVCSNIKKFKYEWIWNKKLAGNPLNAKRAPLKTHESIMVFNFHDYYPIMTQGELKTKGGPGKRSEIFGKADAQYKIKNDLYYPKSILDQDLFSLGNRNKKDLYHPTQKPLDLIKYLILTYSKERDTVFDPFMGSGTTAVACKELNRNFIGCEIEAKYCKIAEKRLKETVKALIL